MGIPGWVTKACVVSLLWATAAAAPRAQTFTKLHTFDGTDGGGSAVRLLQATNGMLYGTTAYGGASDSGTIYRIGTTGAFSSLYSFCLQSGCPDGENPFGALVQARDGNFYGTTLNGGAPGFCTINTGCGVVFKITASGAFTTLYSFCSQASCADGATPAAGLVLGADGNLYGTTETGGPNANCPRGCGTVFRITLGGALTAIHTFCSVSECLDGVAPTAGLILGNDNNFYGTTSGGGAATHGVVFKISSGGVLTTLYSFCSLSNCTDGLGPVAAVAQGSDGNFYGTTSGGGADSAGTIFKLTPAGQLTTLYNLCSQSDCADGEGASALVQATDGNFYGAMSAGGGNNEGTIFQISSSGTLATLYNFCPKSGCGDGVEPLGGLIQDTNGTLYGTAFAGGPTGHGSVYSLSVGLGPFVELQPASGVVGAAVKILGTNLTGATSVAFNGTAAVFTVVSSSEITTTVPTGATSGKVRVVTPGGPLTSNTTFRVLP
jgi:uncharacterized repeat protein (TIGR03803 family)